MERVPNWEERLNDCVAEWYSREHEWGEADCVMWSADAIHAQTGHDPAKDFRGKYHTEEEALQVIKDQGYLNIAEWMDDLFPRRVRSAAQRGDLILNNEGNLGIVWAGGVALCVGENGMIRVPREDWRKAWCIG
jgi:hypothetical protein